jgi:hypothetical protein
MSVLEAEAMTPEGAFGSDDLPFEDSYKSISRLAVCAIIFTVLGLLGFMVGPMHFFTAVGLLCGLLAVKSIRTYPDEFTGNGIARLALIIGFATLVTAPIYHIYVYNTEVPEGFERIDFAELKSKYGEPDAPTEYAKQYNGKDVFVKGYILQNSVSTSAASQFILVPDLATCCFGSQPPLTHMIQVNLTGDQLATFRFKKFKLAGRLSVDETLTPVNNVGGVFYTLNASHCN